MPVEIRELVIKAVIDNSARQGEPDTGSASSANGGTGGVRIEEIVTQVLQAIEEHKNER